MMHYPHILEEGVSFLGQYIRRVLRKELVFGAIDIPIPQVPGLPVMNGPEAITFWLALAPSLDPAFLDTCIREAIPEAGDFPGLGGVRGKQHRGFLPTGETAMYLIAGNSIGRRLELMELFSSKHFFSTHKILSLSLPLEDEPLLSGKISIDRTLVEKLTTGQIQEPKFSKAFPAKRIHTELDWEDLIVERSVKEELETVFDWVKHQYGSPEIRMPGKHIKPGFRALFYGPPGTGKTLAASLLGQATELPVFRVDLASVVSKYIGETEKNLSGLFDIAENKQWILFFDEADALFGKRTNVGEAKDRFANQEVSYLLQRVEDYDGLVILASNFKSNIDDAFLRRFHAVVHFPKPGIHERLALWKAAIPKQLRLDEAISIDRLSRKYELTGADIAQVIRFASIRAELYHKGVIQEKDIIQGIRREFQKAGKIMKG